MEHLQDLVVLKNELGEEFTYDELNEIMSNVHCAVVYLL